MSKEERLREAINQKDWLGFEQLIKDGANVNVRYELKNGVGVSTPLEQAIFQGMFNFAQYLVEHGADIEAEDINGLSALSQTIDYGNYNFAEYLIKRGADVEHKDKYGQTPLFTAIQSDTEFVDLLLENGADIEAEDEDGNTPLLAAAKIKNFYMMKYLVEECGAKINVENREGGNIVTEYFDKRWEDYGIPNMYEFISFLFRNGYKP